MTGSPEIQPNDAVSVSPTPSREAADGLKAGENYAGLSEVTRTVEAEGQIALTGIQKAIHKVAETLAATGDVTWSVFKAFVSGEH